MGKVTVRVKASGAYTQEFSGYEGQACDITAEKIKAEVTKHLGVTQTEYCPLPSAGISEVQGVGQAQEA